MAPPAAAAVAVAADGGTAFNNLLDFAYQCQLNNWMSEADFNKIYNDITTTNVASNYFYGRVNVNTASADVLTALFMGLNPNTINEQTASGAAQTLITYREQNPGNLNTLWWLIDALGNNNPVITALRPAGERRRRLCHHQEFSVHRRHRGGRALRARLPAREIHFRHQPGRADHSLSPGLEPARLGAGRQGAADLAGEQHNAMNNILKINFRKRKKLTSVLGLALDGSRLDGVVLRRTNGSLQVQQSFSAALTLDPLTAAPELVGREIRNQLDAAGVRERHCVLGVPLKWVLTAHTELPPLPEADAASLLQTGSRARFSHRRGDAATGQFQLPAGRRTKNTSCSREFPARTSRRWSRSWRRPN